jgi:Asp-tRNA(Asn)/Glu-tRNA(Gln) amidotransferase B subunit
MSDERAKILKMVADGKISVKDAEELLDLTEHDQEKDPEMTADRQESDPTKNLRFLRVEVNSSDGDNVDVKIPLSLLRAGIKLSSVMPKNVSDKVSSHLSEHGMDIDLNNVRPQDIEQIISSLGEMEVNVDSKDGDKVKIFCE